MKHLSSFARVSSQSPYLDGTKEVQEGPLLGSPNRMKFMVFCANTQHGTTITTAEGALRLTWENVSKIIRAIDESGIEAVVPLSGWKHGDETPEDSRIFETFTWSAAVAAMTKNIQILTTLAMPLFPPVMATKMLATVDHISGGRAGLNVVAGWNVPNFAMFGMELREHDDRYKAADEWMSILLQLCGNSAPFDYVGEYYNGKGLVSEPKPIQRPRPVIMSAGMSPAGAAFAQKHADINFCAFQDEEQGAQFVKAAQKAAWDNHKREIMLGCGGWIVCRDTEKEAREYADYVIKEKGNRALGALGLAEMMPQSRSLEGFQKEIMLERYMAGFFGIPLVGTPEQIVDKLDKVSKAGIGGMAISWVDYEEGLAQYKDKLLPLMIQAGLREK